MQLPSYREDLLLAVFGFAYLLAVQRGRLLLAVPLFALALLSKESALALPALAAAWWWLWPVARPGRRAMRSSAHPDAKSSSVRHDWPSAEGAIRRCPISEAPNPWPS